jgi:hypothetical protein
MKRLALGFAVVFAAARFTLSSRKDSTFAGAILREHRKQLRLLEAALGEWTASSVALP